MAIRMSKTDVMLDGQLGEEGQKKRQQRNKYRKLWWVLFRMARGASSWRSHERLVEMAMTYTGGPGFDSQLCS